MLYTRETIQEAGLKPRNPRAVFPNDKFEIHTKAVELLSAAEILRPQYLWSAVINSYDIKGYVTGEVHKSKQISLIPKGIFYPPSSQNIMVINPLHFQQLIKTLNMV